MKSSNDTLKRFINDSGVYYRDCGDHLDLRFGKNKTCVEAINERVARFSIYTGIFSSQSTETTLRAVMFHFEGWRHKIASYLLSESGEVVAYCDREIFGPEDAALTLFRLMLSLDESREKLARASKGMLPSEAISSSTRRNVERIILDCPEIIEGMEASDLDDLFSRLDGLDD